MGMKFTELEKRLGLKIENRRKQKTVLDRYGRKSGDAAKADNAEAHPDKKPTLVEALLSRSKQD